MVLSLNSTFLQDSICLCDFEQARIRVEKLGQNRLFLMDTLSKLTEREKSSVTDLFPT